MSKETVYSWRDDGVNGYITIETKDRELFNLIRDAAEYTQNKEKASKSKLNFIMSFVKYMGGKV